MSEKQEKPRCLCVPGNVRAHRQCPYHGENGTMIIQTVVDKQKKFIGFRKKPSK